MSKSWSPFPLLISNLVMHLTILSLGMEMGGGCGLGWLGRVWDGHTGRFMSKSRSPFPILISKLAMHQSLLGLDLGGGWLESWCRFVFLFLNLKLLIMSLKSLSMFYANIP